MNSFYSQEELKELGLKYIGNNVLISKKLSIYGSENIIIGDNSRIDDYCILSGKISIGHNVHVAAGVYLFAGNTGIDIEDYAGVSSRTCIYAESDDYSGEYLSNPTIPERYKNVTREKVKLCKHSLIGTGCTILPGVTIGVGTAVGSMSLVNRDLEPWGIYIGIPCKKIKQRRKSLLNVESLYEEGE